MGKMSVSESFAKCIAIFVFIVACLDVPFFNLPVIADLDRSFQVVKLLLPVRKQSLILTYKLSCCDRVSKELPDQ